MPQGFPYGEIRIYDWLDIIHSTRKLNSFSFPWSQTIYWNKSLIPFTQIISTNYYVACFFSFTTKIYLKKLVGTKSFNTKQCLVKWSPTIITPVSLTFFPKMSPSFNIDSLFPPGLDCLRLPLRIFPKSCTVSTHLFCWGRVKSFSPTFRKGRIRKKTNAWGDLKIFCHRYLLEEGSLLYFLCTHLLRNLCKHLLENI